MTASQLYRTPDDTIRFVEHADGTADLQFLTAGRVTATVPMLRADTTSLLRAIADQGAAELRGAGERAGAL